MFEVAAAAACAVAGAYAANRAERQQSSEVRPVKKEKPLDQVVREHQMRIAADVTSTRRQAMLGAFLLLAMVVTAGACIWQLIA